MEFNKESHSTHWLSNVCLIALAILFFTNWPGYHLTLGGPQPFVYYAATCVFALLFIFLRPRALGLLLTESIFYWLLVYLLSGLLWLVLIDSGHIPGEDTFLRARLLMLVPFATYFVLAVGVDYRLIAKIWFGCAVFIVVCFWIDFLFPYTFLPADHVKSNPGRAAGFFMNANFAGTSLVLICMAIMPFIEARWRILLVLVMSIGVFPTLSRSSILFAMFVLAIWVWRGFLDRKTVLVMVFIAPIAIFVVSVLFSIGIQSSEIKTDNVMMRLNFFDPSTSAVSDHSSIERAYLAELGWQKFTERPLTGYGFGKFNEFSNEWGFRMNPHNMYLHIMFEQGILGGLMYLIFIGMILYKGVSLYRRALSRQEAEIAITLMLIAAYFCIFGFLNHNLLGEAVSSMVLACFLAKERNIIHSKMNSNR